MQQWQKFPQFLELWYLRLPSQPRRPSIAGSLLLIFITDIQKLNHSWRNEMGVIIKCGSPHVKRAIKHFLMTGTEQYRSSKQCSAQTYRRPILSVSRSQISDRICIKLIYVRPQGLLSNKGEEGGGGRGSSQMTRKASPARRLEICGVTEVCVALQ